MSFCFTYPRCEISSVKLTPQTLTKFPMSLCKICSCTRKHSENYNAHSVSKNKYAELESLKNEHNAQCTNSQNTHRNISAISVIMWFVWKVKKRIQDTQTHSCHYPTDTHNTVNYWNKLSKLDMQFCLRGEKILCWTSGKITKYFLNELLLSFIKSNKFVIINYWCCNAE